MTKSARAIDFELYPSDLARPFCRLCATDVGRAGTANARGPAPVPKKSVVARAVRNTRP